MAKEKPSSAVIGFIGADEIHFYTINKFLVRFRCTTYRDKETRKYSCTCTEFKTTLTSCAHTQVASKKPDNFKVRSMVGVHDYTGGNASDILFMTQEGTFFLSKSFPRMSLYDLFVFILNNKIPPHIQRGEEKRSLNFDDLKHECNECYINAKSIAATMLTSTAKGKSYKTDAAKVEPSVTLKPWESVEKPESSEFYVSDEVWYQLLFGIYTQTNILLVGPSGCGKSEVVYFAAKKSGIPIQAFNFGAMSEPRTSLIGLSHFDKEKGTWFKKSRFVDAVTSEMPQIVLADEITRSDRGAFNILLPLLDRQGYLALDESDDSESSVVRKGAGVSFVATANVGMEYTGTEALDKALKDRHSIIIEVAFPPEEAEVGILQGRTGVDFNNAQKLVKIASTQRARAAKGEFYENISPRMLLAAANQISKGFDFSTALKYNIINHFSAEGGEESDRVKILQLVQKYST